MKRTLLVLILVSQLFPAAFGAEKQQRRMTAIEYIDTYKNLAVEAMQEYGIPASIKMAQALVESDSGNSPLALNANNHFGIKCKSTWKGGIIYHDDDQKDECFRSYRSAYDSFRDHSDFLSGSQRYRFLFNLNPTDYRSWARGLSQAGYATNPDYSNMLIRTIEQYGLQNLDLEVANSGAGRKEPEQPTVTTRVTDNTRPPQQPETKNDTPRRNETLPPPMTGRPSGSRGQNGGPVIVPPPKVIGSTTRPPRSSRPELPDADGSLDPDYTYRPPYTSATSVTSRPPYTTNRVVTIPRPTVVSSNNRIQQTASSDRLPQTSTNRYPQATTNRYPQNTVKRPQTTTTTVTRPQTPSKPSYKPQQDDYYEYDNKRPRKQISMIPAPEPVRPSGTSEGAYGAPLGAPAGYYNGPKFDPAGMPSAGKKRGVPIYKNNGCLCVIASQGQTLESIASSLRIRKGKLMKYNEFDSEPTGITAGSIVYISPKTNVVRNGYVSHQVIKGETLNYVSQKYGIHVAKLAKVNGMPLTYQIKRGQRLKLQ